MKLLWVMAAAALLLPGQLPKGIQAIQVQDAKCEQRLVVGADALFAYDEAALSKDAEEAAGPGAAVAEERG